jgi:hypothetical protein
VVSGGPAGVGRTEMRFEAASCSELESPEISSWYSHQDFEMEQDAN